MKRAHRILLTAVATALLGLISAAPAQADVNANVLGGTATALMDGVVDAHALGAQLLNIPNPLEGVI
ncbi:hypothetical protein VR41_13725 [Streptomyces sp. NRRL B-1568]|nr:hypothetical protein VR41_13725 [Streptomyces sp. NRRL B-1568]